MSLAMAVIWFDGVLRMIVVPEVAAALGHTQRNKRTVIDGEVQSHYAIAAVGGGEGLGVITRLGVGLPVPGVILASDGGEVGGE